MPLKSLGLASDVLVLRGQSTLEELDDRFILRSPNEPTFWFGNTVIFKTDQVDPETQIARFRAEFPDAEHVTIQWDQTQMAPDERLEAYSKLGFKTDACDVLVLTGALTRSSPPDGIIIRPLASDDDWAQATELQGITGVAEGHDADDFLPYVKTRMDVCRRQTESGLACWFGAFAGDELAADLGIYADERTARFQAVETREAYRRRGICAAMVTAGADWALSKHPDTKLVIIAETDGPAGRIYRRCGFERTESLISVYRGKTKADT